ncbi:MAG: glycosyltransferase family 4 protein [Bryobacteraceae bacterium]
MKVLHADAGREMRGGQWQVLNLHAGLGSDSTLLCRPGSLLMLECRKRGIRAEALSIASLAANSRKADLTHVHDARSHTWAAAVGRSLLVVSRRVAFPIGRSWLSAWKYSRADHYIAVSQHVRSILCAAGIPASKISVVYDGVDVPAQAAAGPDIVAVATDDPMKGTALLEEAAAIAGIQIRYSTNLPGDLSRAALFVYITHSEGLGSAVLLALAAGVPVVASNVGGLPEIIQDGQNGLLTQNNAPDIADAMQRALAMRESLAKSARKSVEAGFTTTAMVNNTIRVYEEVLGC